jgi:hypothetical protein
MTTTTIAFLFALFIFTIIQTALLIGVVQHLKVILKYLDYMCDTMDRTIDYEEEYEDNS